MQTEQCPGCMALLPRREGPAHRYIGASAACWAIFSALQNADHPPLAPRPFNALLPDAYAAQHPGEPNPQAIQSVAVHLLTLYAVLEGKAQPNQALWLRQRTLRPGSRSRRDRFTWLAPPDFTSTPKPAEIVQLAMPEARTAAVDAYVRAVWAAWQPAHGETVAAWYEQFIAPNRL